MHTVPNTLFSAVFVATAFTSSLEWSPIQVLTVVQDAKYL